MEAELLTREGCARNSMSVSAPAERCPGKPLHGRPMGNATRPPAASRGRRSRPGRGPRGPCGPEAPQEPPQPRPAALRATALSRPRNEAGCSDQRPRPCGEGRYRARPAWGTAGTRMRRDPAAPEHRRPVPPFCGRRADMSRAVRGAAPRACAPRPRRPSRGSCSAPRRRRRQSAG